ncbi:MAG: hypothetical protein OER77_08410 [Myxococcales bacterium]|nr:hypothetical protein [Myxococcales bacterium]
MKSKPAWAARCSIVLASLALPIAAFGCGGEGTGDSRGTRVEGTEPGDCEDGADNDGDGFFDCADRSCAASPLCGGGAGGTSGTGGAGGVGGSVLCADVDCGDQNECTTDTCDPVDGECVYTLVTDGTTCDFGGLPGVCGVGACEDAMLCAGVDCDDGNECTTDTCHPADGLCDHVDVIDSTTCDFGGLPGVCTAGTCEDAMLCAGVVCDDGNECTMDDCDPMDGQCDHSNMVDGTACDFGGFPGVCTVGVCEDAMLCAGVDCDDSNECTADTCDPMDGQCDHTNVMDGTACDFQGGPGMCDAGACVYARSWGVPQLIEESDFSACYYPSIAADSSGRVTAIWTHEGGASANQYTPGNGWGTVLDLGGTGATDPNDTMDIAVDANGNAVTVWSQGNGVWSNHYIVGSGWQSAELISPTPSSQRRHPRVAVDPLGNATAVWIQGSPYYVWTNRYTPSGGWGTAEVVPGSSGNVHEPAVAADGDGNVTVVWAQWDAVIFNVYAARYTASGWGSPVLIETENSPGTGTQVAADSMGNVTAVWVQSGTRANRFVPGQGWSAQAVPVPAGSNPRVAAGPGGTAVVVSSGGTSWYEPGAGWGPAQAHGLLNRVDLSVVPSGMAAAVGTRNGELTKDVWANHYAPDSEWGDAVLIETNDTGDAFGPTLVLDPGGDITVIWAQYDGNAGNRLNIWSNRFQ